ncbi:SRPBCC family protein [Noviherbaspirillum sedimenti]|uniref:Polyketide cyclase n=1 Tax=Noviherbaspirillum sedimenti TaxID=2320865 RepID=A0A3A3G220_9BURK|nr:SRPBCC family protein [Noviherbaspirillum sedimenti]RJG01981.1 polyketide cyclase [Noviherbaspirillum sedimenti]
MREAGNHHYHLTTLWQFDAPLEIVWDAIFHSEAWPGWWNGAECIVTLERGEADGLGARQRYTWKGVLPYRLSFVMRVTRIEPLRLLEGCVEGDLEGTGCWRFERDQGLTTVRYEWQVRTTRLWMNLLAPLAKPLFRWNHDAIMRAGGIGLARHLRAGRSAQTARSC